MSERTREYLWGVGIAVVLLLVTIGAAIQEARSTQEQSAPVLSSTSSLPTGARALWLWLDVLNYAPSRHVGILFAVPDRARVVLMLEPTTAVTTEEWSELTAWIDAGGTLVVAGNKAACSRVFREFEFYLGFLTNEVETLIPQTPLWIAPPLDTPVTVHTNAYLDTTRNDFVTHLAAGGNPVIASFEQGKGRVILSSAPFPFTNAGLKEKGSPELILNLIGAASESGIIWFDEWHHGVIGTLESGGPSAWLRSTAAGHALLYTAAIAFAALLLRGQHFGRPIPLAETTSRRAPVEYITAIANLRRRTGHRAAELEYYHHCIKRDLGQRFRLNPRLPDAEYITELKACNPDLDTDALTDLLAQLRRKDVNESDMVRTAQAASQWLKE